MSSAEQSERLAAEFEVMQALADESDILEFKTTGDPPKEYEVTLRGKGISHGSPFEGEVECSELHKFQMRLGYSYPEYPPEVRWLTSVFHPNISSSGFVRLDECGLRWQKELTLDVVCEKLWDVVRGAYVNIEKASNYSAKKWYAEQAEITLPVDGRPLRSRGGPAPDNVIRYQRGTARTEPASDDVLYIGEDTPQPPPPPPSRRQDDDDVLYIGDE